jgi:hypothetical protein
MSVPDMTIHTPIGNPCRDSFFYMVSYADFLTVFQSLIFGDFFLTNEKNFNDKRRLNLPKCLPSRLVKTSKNLIKNGKS